MAELTALLVTAFLLGLVLGYLLWIYGWRSRTRTRTAVETRVEVDSRVEELEAELAALRQGGGSTSTAATRDTPAPEDRAAPPEAPRDRARASAARRTDDDVVDVRDDASADEPGPAAPDTGTHGTPDRDVARDVAGPGATSRPASGPDDDAVALVVDLPEPVAPDDLTAIDGVGPRMHEALRGAGITTFVALARAGEDELRDAIRRAGLRLAPTLDTWPTQAADLARHTAGEHTARDSGLVTGRDGGRG